MTVIVASVLLLGTWEDIDIGSTGRRTSVWDLWRSSRSVVQLAIFVLPLAFVDINILVVRLLVHDPLLRRDGITKDAFQSAREWRAHFQVDVLVPAGAIAIAIAILFQPILIDDSSPCRIPRYVPLAQYDPSITVGGPLQTHEDTGSVAGISPSTSWRCADPLR